MVEYDDVSKSGMSSNTISSLPPPEQSGTGTPGGGAGGR